jgi:outer membrane autotransporter protein
MKKTLLATLLATFVLGASALELGINGSSDRTDNNHKDAGIGLTLGQHFGKLSATAGVDFYQKTDALKASLVAGYDVATFGPVTTTVKVGGLYLDQRVNEFNLKAKDTGFAGVVGAGVSVNVMKNVALTADYRYEAAASQSTIKAFNGNTYAAGVKVTF